MSKYNKLIEAMSSVQSKFRFVQSKYNSLTDLNKLNLTKKDFEEIQLMVDESAVIVKKICHKIEVLTSGE